MSPTSSFEAFGARLRAFMAASEQRVEAEFNRLALDLFALQYEHNPAYRAWCDRRDLTPRKVDHWSRIPSMPTSAFKDLELTCLPREHRAAVFFSSGTTEQRPSRHFHNTASLALYEASALRWFERHLLPEWGTPGANASAGSSASGSAGSARIEQWDLVMLTPSPAEVPHSSLVHMFEAIRRAFCPGRAEYLGRVDPRGAWVLDFAAARECLRRAGERPLLLLGTAFSFVHLLEDPAGRDLRLRLPPGSRVMETGGYKGRSRALPKSELHALMTARFGIPAGAIVCEYGMSELSSQAYDTVASLGKTPGAARRFQFPPWVRVRILSPETGFEVGEGETGLIQVLDLANVYSMMAIQTEDLGVRSGDGFELVGRAVLAEPRGCSLMAP